jgi:hypothetical protein
MLIDRMSDDVRDDECTMSVHRAVASKSDDVATMSARLAQGCCRNERRRAQGVLEQGSIKGAYLSVTHATCSLENEEQR